MANNLYHPLVPETITVIDLNRNRLCYACAVRIECGFLETRPQKAAVQFLSEKAKKCKLFVDSFCCDESHRYCH